MSRGCTRIERYRALCADGRTLDEQRTLTDIHQGRWKPSTIVRLEWECNGRLVEISHIYGLMAQLLPDRSGVAILRASLRSRFSPALEADRAGWRNRFTLESPIRIDDHDVAGEFALVRSGRGSRASGCHARAAWFSGRWPAIDISCWTSMREDRRDHGGDAAAVVAATGFD